MPHIHRLDLFGGLTCKSQLQKLLFHMFVLGDNRYQYLCMSVKAYPFMTMQRIDIGGTQHTIFDHIGEHEETLRPDKRDILVGEAFL